MFTRKPYIIKSFTLTTIVGTYAYGEQIGTLQTISDFSLDDSASGKLVSVSIVDKAMCGAPLDILFFSDEPTVASSPQAAADISDAEMASKFLGCAFIPSSNFGELANSFYSTTNGLDLILKPVVNKRLRSIYALVVSRGIWTFTGTSDLKFLLGFEQG